MERDFTQETSGAPSEAGESWEGSLRLNSNEQTVYTMNPAQALWGSRTGPPSGRTRHDRTLPWKRSGEEYDPKNLPARLGGPGPRGGHLVSKEAGPSDPTGHKATEPSGNGWRTRAGPQGPLCVPGRTPAHWGNPVKSRNLAVLGKAATSQDVVVKRGQGRQAPKRRDARWTGVGTAASMATSPTSSRGLLSPACALDGRFSEHPRYRGRHQSRFELGDPSSQRDRASPVLDGPVSRAGVEFPRHSFIPGHEPGHVASADGAASDVRKEGGHGVQPWKAHETLAPARGRVKVGPLFPVGPLDA